VITCDVCVELRMAKVAFDGGCTVGVSQARRCPAIDSPPIGTSARSWIVVAHVADQSTVSRQLDLVVPVGLPLAEPSCEIDQWSAGGSDHLNPWLEPSEVFAVRTPVGVGKTP